MRRLTHDRGFLLLVAGKLKVMAAEFASRPVMNGFANVPQRKPISFILKGFGESSGILNNKSLSPVTADDPVVMGIGTGEKVREGKKKGKKWRQSLALAQWDTNEQKDSNNRFEARHSQWLPELFLLIFYLISFWRVSTFGTR